MMIVSKRDKAKELAYTQWLSTLSYLRKHIKCRDYGEKETADSLWQKLPKVSKEFWLHLV